MPSVDLASHSVAYEVRGDGDAILLLGGSGEPMVAWELCGLVDALVEAGHRVIWYAARGVAPSGCPPLPWTLEAMAADASRLLDHLEVESCTGIGYSLGGFTLEELARREPGRIGGAILMASAGQPGGTIREAFIEAENTFVATLGEVPRPFSRLMTLTTALGGPELTNPKLVAEWWELLGHQHDQWAGPHGEVGQAQVAKDWMDRGSTSGAPWPAEVKAAIVCFEHDPMFPPSEAEAIAAHLGNARLEVVPRTGHAGLMNQPQAAVEVILKILASWTVRADGHPAHPSFER